MGYVEVTIDVDEVISDIDTDDLLEEIEKRSATERIKLADLSLLQFKQTIESMLGCQLWAVSNDEIARVVLKRLKRI